MAYADSAPARRTCGANVSPTNWRSSARGVSRSKRSKEAGSVPRQDVELDAELAGLALEETADVGPNAEAWFFCVAMHLFVNRRYDATPLVIHGLLASAEQIFCGEDYLLE